MCTTRPITDASLANLTTAAGHSCPLCDNDTRIQYMRFLDPHGVERVDAEVFECEAKRHTFAGTDDGIRLLAADGKRPATRVAFTLTEGRLAPA